MNYLITETEIEEVCPGTDHATTCKKLFGIKLQTFLKRGGVRVKIHLDSIAVEYTDELVDFQVKEINRLLRENIIYRLVTPFKVVDRFTRPVRRIVK